MLIEIAKTIPHNKTQLTRYMSFISWCKIVNIDANQIYEKHHILPKSIDMFPEHKFNPDNIINLTYRQHYIAHWMLAKVYNTPSQQLAFFLMSSKLGKTSSKIYEYIKTQRSLFMTNSNPNHNGQFSKASWNISSTERRINQSKTMAETNKKHKSKPKEIRYFICSRCTTPIERLEFIHHKPKTRYYCSNICHQPNTIHVD